MAKRRRLCPICHLVGITVYCETGNELRKHVAIRHPRTKAQKTQDKNRLREYRRGVLLALGKSMTR